MLYYIEPIYLCIYIYFLVVVVISAKELEVEPSLVYDRYCAF
jgi:hypothetical protein